MRLYGKTEKKFFMQNLIVNMENKFLYERSELL